MRVALFLIFAVYLGILVKVVLFKDTYFFDIVPTNEYYKERASAGAYMWHNFVPFRTITLYLSGPVSFSSAFFNLAGNVLLFVPFGFLLPMVSSRMKNFLTVSLIAFIISVAFELYQFFTHTGQCDVDDVILNTAGSVTGFSLVLLFTKLTAVR